MPDADSSRLAGDAMALDRIMSESEMKLWLGLQVTEHPNESDENHGPTG